MLLSIKISEEAARNILFEYIDACEIAGVNWDMNEVSEHNKAIKRIIERLIAERYEAQVTPVSAIIMGGAAND